jgi:hypothetical protein
MPPVSRMEALRCRRLVSGGFADLLGGADRNKGAADLEPCSCFAHSAVGWGDKAYRVRQCFPPARAAK